MKLPLAIGFVGVSLLLSAGCASTNASNLASVASMRSGGGGLSTGAASAVARGIADERVGGMSVGVRGNDDFHTNEAATFSDREPQFAGPTPQVPIPRDGRQGQPTDW